MLKHLVKNYPAENRCLRCKGNLFKVYDEYVCLQCGRIVLVKERIWQGEMRFNERGR